MQLQFQDQLKEILQLLIEPMTTSLEIKIVKEGEQWRVTVNTDQNELLVGFKGETIKAIQHIARVMVHKKFPDDRTHFLIDIGEYKKSRETLISSKITNIAEIEVLEKGKTLILTNLNSYERRIVHNLLNEIKGIETTSVGEEANRKLIIRPTSGELMATTGMDNALILDIEALEKNPEQFEAQNPEES
jgi:spoIIIJ-associated protein